MPAPTDAHLKFWAEHNYNVILRGLHGVGKTARIKALWDGMFKHYLYFSAATMDPWVDFVGIPKEVTENGISYLELIRPKHFAMDEVEAIFLDEYNRSPKKVRNSVMELIQFKSINGKRFKNLKIVWAAINPDDEETSNNFKYDVEPIDPAQLDRFDILADIPYQPSEDYFKEKYGTEIGMVAINWWNSLSEKQKRDVSPRRLDMAIHHFNDGDDIRFVMPQSANISELIMHLNTKGAVFDLNGLMKDNDTKKAKEMLTQENMYNAMIPHIVKSVEKVKFFIPLLEKEKLVQCMQNNKKVQNEVFDNYDKYQKIVDSIAISGTSRLSSKALDVMNKNKEERKKREISLSDIELSNLMRDDNIGSIIHIISEEVDKLNGLYFQYSDIKKKISFYDLLYVWHEKLSRLPNKSIGWIPLHKALDIYLNSSLFKGAKTRENIGKICDAIYMSIVNSFPMTISQQLEHLPEYYKQWHSFCIKNGINIEYVNYNILSGKYGQFFSSYDFSSGEIK